LNKLLKKILMLFGDIILDVAGDYAEKKGVSGHTVRTSKAALRMLTALADKDDNNLTHADVGNVIGGLVMDGDREPIERHAIKIIGRF
jgi:hypothetical protein